MECPYAIYQEEKQFQNYTTPGTDLTSLNLQYRAAWTRLDELWEMTE